MANSSFLIFGKFMGTGLVVTWFLAGLVYLFLSEKNKTRRILFIYMPVLILLLFFNPLFNQFFVWATEEEISWDFIRLALASVADLAVIPIQDYLSLDGEARINLPSTLGGNWTWRLKKGQFTPEIIKRCREMNQLYGRGI